MKIFDVFKIILSLVLVFGLIWITVMEFPYFSNTIGIYNVLWKGAVIWIPLSLVLASVISTLAGFHWYNGLIIGLMFGVLTFPLFSSLANRIGQESKAYNEEIVFLGMDARLKDRGVRQVGPIPSPDEYHVFFGDEDDPLRLIVGPDPFWTQIEPGDTVSLRWIPGRLAGKTFKSISYKEMQLSPL